MAAWNEQETVNLVHRKHGHLQRQLAEPSLRSLPKRLGYAYFHTREAKRHFDKNEQDVLQGRGFDAIHATEDARADHNIAQFAMAAHATAATQSLHSLADILAHALFYSLKLNLGVAPILKERDITYDNVLTCIGQMPAYFAVSAAMQTIKNADTFSYLHALVNQSKHREVIGSGIWFDNTGADPEPYEFRFEAFVRDGKAYGTKEVEPFLLGEGIRLNQAIVDTLQAVNAALTHPCHLALRASMES